MARAFLVDVARNLGREEADCPFIKKLVLEEWLDSLTDLQQLSAERWESFRAEYHIPARFLDAARAALSQRPPGLSKVLPIGSAGHAEVAPSPLCVPAVASSSTGFANPSIRFQQESWASTPSLLERSLQYYCNPNVRGSGMLSPALQRILLTDSNVLTYGLLGKTVQHSSLSDAAAFAKAAWVDKPELDQDSPPRDLLKDLHIIDAIDPPHPPIGSSYGVALVIGDCSLDEFRQRLQLAARLKHQGILGDNVSLQVCAGVEVNSKVVQTADQPQPNLQLEVKAVVNEILGIDAARVLSIQCVAAPSQAAMIFRTWLRVAPDMQPGQPLLLISSQPYALWHQLVLDKILRKSQKWSTKWPPELVHVAAVEAPAEPPWASAFDAIGRVLVELDAKLATTTKIQHSSAVSRL